MGLHPFVFAMIGGILIGVYAYSEASKTAGKLGAALHGKKGKK